MTLLFTTVLFGLIAALGVQSENSESSSSSSSPISNLTLIIEEKIAFEEFKEELNKTYDTRRDEKKAFRNFKESFELVKSHNEEFANGSSTFQMALNKDADQPDEYFIDRLNFDLGYEISERGDDDWPVVPRCTLESLNYTAEGYVNGVKNQGRCGACYAFAVAGACEGAFFKKFKKLYKIAEQQIVDCTRNEDFGNRGCTGGKISASYAYLASWMAMNESEYPYKAKESDKCLYNHTVAVSKITRSIRLANVNETYLKDLLCHFGPLTVGLDASAGTFQYYSSGVYYDSTCKNFINHAMVLIGFGTDPELGPYWLLKNSYGRKWGERGYIRIARGMGSICGLLDQITICVLL